MSVYNNVLEMIGRTPLVRINRLETGPCELFVKLESLNPGGSIKDRIGLHMIDAAERDGLITPGTTLVEGTAGNTGLGLALAAAQKGYPLILVVPDKMSREKIFNLKAMGAEVILTRSDVAKGHPQYYQDLAQSIADATENSFFINQFGNPENARAHELTTAPEIWEQMQGRLDAVVLGVGSSGTVTGLSDYFRKTAPDVELVIADPVGSILAEYVNDGHLSTKSSSWLVEGIGEDFLPPISDFTHVSQAISVSDADSFAAGRELLRKEGILGGSSTGTIIAAACRYCQAQSEPKRVVAFVCDTGNKYLSKMYNDYWMLDNGFLERAQHGNLRDLIMRPYWKHDTVTVGPAEPLTTAYARMKLYDVSQLPVIDGDRIVGIIDESDILMAVYDHEDRFAEAVSSAMVSELDFVEVNADLKELLPIFDAGKVAIVLEAGQFLGLITRIDLLNYLRRRMG